jgi:DNA gyrase subunit A
MPPNFFKIQGRGGRGLKGLDLKEEDKVYKMLVANTHDDIFFFTNNGKVFKTKVYEIPTSSRTSKGKLVHTFLGLSDNDVITAVIAYNSKESKEKYFAMATENGIIKKTAISEFDNIRTTGIIAITLKEDDTLRWVKRSTGNDDFLFVTEQGHATRFNESEARPMGRTASGVKAINLKKGDKVKGFTIINEGKNNDLKLLVITEKGFGKKTPIDEYKSQRRGGKGVTTSKITKKTGNVSAASLIDKEIDSVIAFSEKGLVIKTDIKNIRTSGRSTQGVKVMNIKDDDTLVGIFCS